MNCKMDITIDDLKFKEEDCFEATPMGMESDYYGGERDGLHVITLEDANRILAEKLTSLLTELDELRKLKEEVERAPVAFRYSYYNNGEYWGIGPPDSQATHKARLVCIEEVGK